MAEVIAQQRSKRLQRHFHNVTASVQDLGFTTTLEILRDNAMNKATSYPMFTDPRRETYYYLSKALEAAMGLSKIAERNTDGTVNDEK
jgi:hypothetical protein